MSIESEADLEGLRRAGRVVALTLAETRRAVEPGVTTSELDAVACRNARAPWSPLGACARVRLPRRDLHQRQRRGRARRARRRVGSQAGDVVTLDVTAELGGYMADAAVTVLVPPSTPLAERLVRTAETALARGHRRGARGPAPCVPSGARSGGPSSDAGLHRPAPAPGHGIGRTIHEPPDVLNYDEPRNRGRLTPGLVITIEPIISARGQALRQDADGWTVRTRDGSLTAHAEHTVVVTRRGSPLVLTSVA